MTNSLVIPDLLNGGWRGLPFQPFRAGIEICPLAQDDTAISVALLRYAPGASVPRHRHPGLETVLVLDGVQSDEHRRRLVADPKRVVLPRAQAHLRTRNVGEAVAQLERITQVYPGSAQGWALLAEAYDEQGDTEKRNHAAERARELH